MHNMMIGSWSINYNSDFSGDAVIVPMQLLKDKRGTIEEMEEVEIHIPCAVLLEFAGEAVLSKQISDIEQKSGLQVLGYENLQHYIE